MSRLRVTEIFRSLQGEADSVGFPTRFVRLTGCPLRCHFCDTAYAFHGGEQHSLAGVLQRVDALATHHVCVTGGEPLAQKGTRELLAARRLAKQSTVLFSRSAWQRPPRQLADGILEDNLPVRFQLQRHKVLWDDVPGK